MKIVLLTFGFIAVLCSGVLAQSAAESDLAAKLTKGTGSVKALESVLKNPDEHSALTLYLAAGAAFKEKRLEDSGFLLYAAQLRGHFDENCFPAKETGGNSPFVLYAAMSEQVGGFVNPAIMAEPKVFAKAIDRVKAWDPKAPKGYDPGYAFTDRKTEAAARESIKANRKDFIQHMSGLATLLNDTDYFSASRVVKSYNLDPESKRPSRESRDKAIETMKRIQKEKGLDGFIHE